MEEREMKINIELMKEKEKEIYLGKKKKKKLSKVNKIFIKPRKILKQFIKLL
jgi:hypothetical protein